MLKIYDGDNVLKKSVGKICVASKTWHNDRSKRVIGFLLLFLPAVLYTIVYSLFLFIPQFYNESTMRLLNEFTILPILVSSGGAIILGLQYHTITLLPHTENDRILFSDEGFVYTYTQHKKSYSYLVHYKNVNWMMYNEKKKQLVIDCQYVYQSIPQTDDTANPLSIPMFSDIMQNGTIVVPMCFSNIESILTIFLRTTGVSINRGNVV